jgi:hypothetical protein
LPCCAYPDNIPFFPDLVGCGSTCSASVKQRDEESAWFGLDRHNILMSYHDGKVEGMGTRPTFYLPITRALMDAVGRGVQALDVTEVLKCEVDAPGKGWSSGRVQGACSPMFHCLLVSCEELLAGVCSFRRNQCPQVRGRCAWERDGGGRY